MAVSVLPETLRNHRNWHAMLSDPSAADFYRTAFYLDVLRIVVELALVVAIFIFLKPRDALKPPASKSTELLQ